MKVLKLHCQGQNKLQISITTGLSRNTVKKYIRAFTGFKTTWEEIGQQSDKELDERFCVEPALVVEARLAPPSFIFKRTGEKVTPARSNASSLMGSVSTAISGRI
ncbi:MAG: hypothetical protein ABIR06_16120 [Cyclobacteriaceae bacterium]